MVRCSTCNVFHMRQFCGCYCCLAWFDTLNSIVCCVQSIRYMMMKFSLIDTVFNCLLLKCVYWYGYLDYQAHVVYEIAIADITAEYRRTIRYLAWFGRVEFNRLPCLKDEIYDDQGFSGRLCCQLTMFEIRVLVRLSRVLRAHIPYEIAFAKITAEICRISHCLAWFDAVEFNRLPSPNDKMYDVEVFAGQLRNQLAMLEIRALIAFSLSK